MPKIGDDSTSKIRWIETFIRSHLALNDNYIFCDDDPLKLFRFEIFIRLCSLSTILNAFPSYNSRLNDFSLKLETLVYFEPLHALR